MQKIAIIGVGLMGGSLGMALRSRRKGSYHIIGIGRNEKKLALAKKLGAVDEFTTDWQKGVSNADIVVVCTPVDLIAESVKKILPYLKKGAIITDVGSVKGYVIKEVKKVFNLEPSTLNLQLTFIGGHPLAGLEKQGVEHSSDFLYKGANVVLSYDKTAKNAQVKKITKMWRDAGAKIVVLASQEHDRIVALTSHLPHLLAFNLCLLLDKVGKKNSIAPKLTAGSFKDMTRIADSSPHDWAVICYNNRKEVAKAVDLFIEGLRTLKNRLSDTDYLKKKFLAAKIARQNILHKSTGSN